MDEVEKFFFANFQILGPLGCQGWVVIPQNVKISQNHCTLMYRLVNIDLFVIALLQIFLGPKWPNPLPTSPRNGAARIKNITHGAV
jgi:hypothetical protein